MLDARSAGWQCAGYRGPVSDKGREFSRRDVAGWLEGPKASLEDQGFEFGYKGQRLGLPESGPGSVAGFGRRFVALAIDWLACVLIANLVSSGQPEAFLPLVIFFVEVSVLTALMGSSFGQRILGIRVVSLSTGRLDPARSALRTLLLCLVVPPLVFDRDQRGLHDKAANSVAVRMGHTQT
ncbi:MAG: RDD family protein [Actinobacteria bacterium]|nr:RDD family protein [Actinomycetota bacterium]MCB8995695.1 RDD family protein [Actinomycetota bacterium]